MECMCAQTRPQFILSSERVFLGMEFEPMLTPREKSPLLENFPKEEDRTRDAVDSEPKHYQRAIPAPLRYQLKRSQLFSNVFEQIIGCLNSLDHDLDLYKVKQITEKRFKFQPFILLMFSESLRNSVKEIFLDIRIASISHQVRGADHLS